MDIFNYLTNGASAILLVIVLLILNRAGVLKLLLKGSGNGKELKQQLNEIETNHLHEIALKLDKIASNTEKSLYILEDIKDKIIK